MYILHFLFLYTPGIITLALTDLEEVSLTDILSITFVVDEDINSNCTSEGNNIQ